MVMIMWTNGKKMTKERARKFRIVGPVKLVARTPLFHTGLGNAVWSCKFS